MRKIISAGPAARGGRRCNADLIESLIAGGADRRVTDKNGKTPLLLAAALGRADLGALLIRCTKE